MIYIYIVKKFMNNILIIYINSINVWNLSAEPTVDSFFPFQLDIKIMEPSNLC